MQEVVLIIHLVLAVALVIVILMQRSEGGAASLTGGAGATGGFMSARGAANFLTRLTAILAASFIATSLVLAFMAARVDGGGSSVMERVPASATPATPAAPATPAKPEAPAVPFSE